MITIGTSEMSQDNLICKQSFELCLQNTTSSPHELNIQNKLENYETAD